MNEAQMAAFLEVVRGLRESIDKLVTQAQSDHDQVTSLKEQVRQAFIEIKALKSQVEKLSERIVELANPSATAIREEEREKGWRKATDDRLLSLESSRTAIKAEAMSFGKMLLVFILKAIGLGGGAALVAKAFSMMEAVAR